MEGLFFVIDQVWILHPTHSGYFILSIALCAFLFIFYRKNKTRNFSLQFDSQIVFNPINPLDSHYIEKTLIEIRIYLSKIYLPEHSWAHTSKDINEYIENFELVELIKVLEHKEYTWIIIDSTEASDINTQLVKLLP